MNAVKAMAKSRREFVLLWMLTRNPVGISSLNAPPFSLRYREIAVESPGGLSMTTLRGLERSGLIHERVQGLFYLTREGKASAETIYTERLNARR